MKAAERSPGRRHRACRAGNAIVTSGIGCVFRGEVAIMNIHDKAAKGATKPSATLTVDNKQVELSVRSGTIGPDVIDVANLYKDTGCFTYDPGLHVDGELQKLDHLHRRRQGRTALSRLSDRSARGKHEFPRGLLSAALRRAADEQRLHQFPQDDHEPHDGSRADDAVLHRLPA